MGIFNDISGCSFGRWKVLNFNYKKRVGNYYYQMWDCLCVCGNKKIVEGRSLKKGSSISCGCYNREVTRSLSGINSVHWKKKKLGYWGIHQWLYKYFGKANKCEGKNCRKNSNIFNWSLKKKCKYERKRNNFIQLCRSCHMIYDNSKKNLYGFY